MADVSHGMGLGIYGKQNFIYDVSGRKRVFMYNDDGRNISSMSYINI